MIQKKDLKCFKSYDVRGKLGRELNRNISYRIGRSVAQSLNAKTVVVGFDARETSPSLATAVTEGILDAGSAVFNIGLSGTEEVYSAVTQLDADAGIEITASHNPIDYNGMKIVKNKSKPLSSKEFSKIKSLAEEANFLDVQNKGIIVDKQKEAREKYLKKVLSFVDIEQLKTLRIVINSGNGAAGPVLDALNSLMQKAGVKTDFVFVNHVPDPSFPNGIPNPLLEENRSATADIVKLEKADFGVAFDGDFDRCFLFDHQGRFVPGEYVVGLISEVFLGKEKGATVVHDPRVIWNTKDVVKRCGGSAVLSKTGHAFVKDKMRKVRAIYGGEMSAHHYFRDFFYCDSGMVAWLLIWELISKSDSLLGDLVSERKRQFPSSGEINFKISDAKKSIKMVQDFYYTNAKAIDRTDGLSISFENWRFNLRSSNTEPLVRLNVETMGDRPLLDAKKEELTKLIVNA